MCTKIDLTGKVFGRLTVIKEGGRSNTGSILWLCKCMCGKERNVFPGNLTRGLTVSCGCYKDEFAGNRARRHGLSKHPLHYIWRSVLQRCSNPLRVDFHRYGGRGICVCDEWLNDFTSFYNWAVSNGYIKGLQLDRINNNGNYEPKNCRWTDRKTQCRNRSNNVFITHEGQTKTMTEFAEIGNIPLYLMSRRLRDGWAVKDAIYGKNKILK